MVISMSRPAHEQNSEMSEFALWFQRACDRTGLNPSRVSEIAGVDRSYINRLLNSYKAVYRYYKRPSYEKTLAIGKALKDVQGAMQAADRLDEYEDRTGTREANLDEHEVFDYLRGKPEPLQDRAYKMLQAAFDEEDAKDNAGNIGKKAL